MTLDRVKFVGHSRFPVAPLPVTRLEGAASSAATLWLRESLTTFGKNVASFVPGDFPAYARILHPFANPADVELDKTGASRWDVLAGGPILNAMDAIDLAYRGAENAQAPVGTLTRAMMDPLIATLRSSTSTPEECFFALWEGLGDSIISDAITPTLELPHRRYHVFAGSIDDACASYSYIPFSYQSANIWWPADHVWCIASEIDAAWTYVAGSASLIEALLTQSELEIARTSADAKW